MFEDTLIPSVPERGQDRPMAATILNTPAADGDDVYVTIPGVDDEEARQGPCFYSPRGAALPSAGDTAVVVFDDENKIWIIGWWPYA